MEQRVEGEVGPLIEVETCGTPGDRGGMRNEGGGLLTFECRRAFDGFPFVDTDADGGFLLKSQQESFEAFVAHELAGLTDKIFGQCHTFSWFLVAKLKKKLFLCNKIRNINVKWTEINKKLSIK